MSLSYVKRATFLCPALLTGGPEAIHQAAQVLGEQGVPADIAYYGPGSSFRFEDGQVLVDPVTENPCLAAYGKYEPVVCRRFLLRRHHLVVVPEVLAAHAARFTRATVAIWWLSVDNGLRSVLEGGGRALLQNRELKHLHQSAYAAAFLRGNGVLTSHALGDYTDPEFTSYLPASPNPDAGLAYNPAKGADLAAAFFAQHTALRDVPLRGMSKAEVVETLRRTMIYLDFGHFPGRDRLPREAAASGAVVFLRKLGAGAHAEDFAVPDFYRFDEDDVASGELFRRVTAVQADPARFWAEQASFREGIRGERAALADQLLALRGQRRAA
jgi:hypothetical protein